MQDIEMTVMTTKGVAANLWKVRTAHIDIINNRMNVFVEGFVDGEASQPLETRLIISEYISDGLIDAVKFVIESNLAQSPVQNIEAQ